MLRKAFTLMEVNLAILVMAVGILSIVSLYSLGYRENRQSVEDVASAAYAEAVMSPLAMAAGSTNLKWSVFRNIGSYPSDLGWRDYFNNDGLVVANPETKARTVFNSAMQAFKGAASGTLESPVSSWNWSAANFAGLRAGLIVLHEEDSPIVRIGFRAAKSSGQLLSAPMYYTEVRFQGLPNQ